jgi:hypothetical protein
VALLALRGRHSNPPILYLWLFHRGESLSSRASAVINQTAVFTYLGYQPIDGSECHDFPEKKLDKEIKGSLRGIAMGFFTNLRVTVTNGFERNGDISR